MREGKGRRHLAGAEEAGDDGGGDACIQRLRVEFCENRASGRRSGGPSVRKRLEKESRGPRTRAVAVVLATLGSSSRAAVADMLTGLGSVSAAAEASFFFFSFWGGEWHGGVREVLGFGPCLLPKNFTKYK